MTAEQRERVGSAPGFIAALDQSGGSTPGALQAYGVGADRYGSDEEMFDLVHAMRTRIITSPSFDGDRIVAAILFEMTMDRTIDGMAAVDYLWSRKRVVSFLKVDAGLAEQSTGVQLMKPNPGLGDLLERARAKGVFGTKMRSVIHNANVAGIASIVAQQVDVGIDILQTGLVPILEPEVSIHCTDKAEAEELLLEQLIAQLDRLPQGQQVMLKLTIPDKDNLYQPLISDARVLRVVALSGGYSRDDANRKLANNHGMIASFSRALAEGLHDSQTDQEFDAILDRSVGSIFEASVT